jgi:hypothetical protein
MEKFDSPGEGKNNIVRLMRIVYWIHKATNTHSQYVIIIAFPQQHLSVVLNQFHVICTLALFWGNEQENVLARLFPAGATLLQT